MLSASIFALAANRAEISTGNLRGETTAFDNFKANWGKCVTIGDFSASIDAKYDRNANRDFLQEVRERARTRVCLYSGACACSHARTRALAAGLGLGRPAEGVEQR